jgi:hypothetical protein
VAVDEEELHGYGKSTPSFAGGARRSTPNFPLVLEIQPHLPQRHPARTRTIPHLPTMEPEEPRDDKGELNGKRDHEMSSG